MVMCEMKNTSHVYKKKMLVIYCERACSTRIQKIKWTKFGILFCFGLKNYGKNLIEILNVCKIEKEKVLRKRNI